MARISSRLRWGTVAVAAGTAAAAIAATIGGTASGAPTRASVDTYVTAKIASRVPGKNLAVVDVNWAFKCLSDKLGDARYEWTIKLIRTAPKPERTTTVGKGTSKNGTKRMTLAPGAYLPIADPYFCETERGAGSDKPEVGLAFSVPDYCAWSVASAKGQVLLQQGSSVRAARPGAALRPGDAVDVPAGGSAALRSNAGDGTVTAGPSSGVGLASMCTGKTGWQLQLNKGSVSTSIGAKASARLSYGLRSPNATVTGRPGAGWRADYNAGSRRTSIKVLAGSVRVAGKSGKPVTVSKGFTTQVVGTGAPSTPGR